eukprot:gene7806-8003_t
MVGVCCGCIAKPASVQPRKTYNTLIGHLFEGQLIGTDQPIDSSLRRKIQKLQEYVQANPAKIPKVSRRLMRRIKATLLKPGDNLGYVKVAVHAYTYMLAKSADEFSSYSPSFFARELVSGADSVVPSLLHDIHIEMRTLGAELLAVFTKVQTPVDSKLDAIQSHIPLVCKAAQAALTADRKEQRLQETAERRRAGDKLAVPNPIDLMIRRAPAHVAALEVSCLRCLCAVVDLCRRNKVLPEALNAIQAVMLDNLRASREKGSNGGSSVSDSQWLSQLPTAALADAAPADVAVTAEEGGSEPAAAPVAAVLVEVPASVVDVSCYQAMGVLKEVPAGYSQRDLALQLLQQMSSFMQDIATVHKILCSLYDYMDERRRWQEQAVVEDCCVVLGLAAEAGCKLNDCYSLAALSAALQLIPKAWAEQARQCPRIMPMQAFLDFLKGAPAALKDHITPQPSGPDSGPAAEPAAAMPHSSGAANDGAPSQLTAAAADKGDMTAFKKHLAQLREEMLAGVRLLTARVARMLLQQQRRWQELGYVRGAGGGSAATAEAMLLLFNSQVAALAALLGEGQASRISTASNEGHSDRTPLSDRVNVMLVRRMSTLKKELVHVSELMRDSVTHTQDFTPATGGPLALKVAAAFQQPAPAGAFVVRDVKISRIAGELEPVAGMSLGKLGQVVNGQVVVLNPWTTQLQFSGIEVQVQFPKTAFSGATSVSTVNGPIAATSITCPPAQNLQGVLLVNGAVPGSAAGSLVCNFTVQLPSSDPGYVIAQANYYTSSNGPLISQPVGFDFSSIAVQPPAAVGQCALVNDTFDPNTFQALGAPTITVGLKPPRNGEVAAQICGSKTYTYTIQWTVGSAAACGSYIVSSTAVVNPINSNQPTQSTTAYLEVNACNAPQVAMPPPVQAAAVADASAPQLSITVVSTSGGGASYTWGVSNSVSTSQTQVKTKSSSGQVTFTTGFTRSQASNAAPLTLTGVITVTNPTAETMTISEVEASFVTVDNQQQVDTPVSCPDSVGGNIILGANQYVVCSFTVLFDSQNGGAIWGSAVTTGGQQGQSTEATVQAVIAATATAVGSCAMVSVDFSTGGVAQIVPSSFTAGSQVPPSSSSPMQICDSQLFTYTGSFGPFTSCGALTAKVDSMGLQWGCHWRSG